MALCASGAEGFAFPRRPLPSSSSSSATAVRSLPPLRASDGDGDGPSAAGPSLYEILRASPTDSQAEIRRKYTAAARLTHPDSRKPGASTEGLPEFSDIAEAYRILSDPKARLRYDRSRAASSVKDTVGSLLDMGIQAAAPFLFKTGPEQVSRGASDLGNALQDAGTRLERTRAVVDLRGRGGAAAKAAARAERRAAQLRERLGMDRTSPALRPGGRGEGEQLTAAQARRIAAGFAYVEKDEGGGGLPAECGARVDELARAEVEALEALREAQAIERETAAQERALEAQTRKEGAVEGRIEDGRRKLEEVRAAYSEWSETWSEAERAGVGAARDLAKADEAVERARAEEEAAKVRFEEARRVLDEARARRAGCDKDRAIVVKQEREVARQLGLAGKKIDATGAEEERVVLAIEDAMEALEEARAGREEGTKALKAAAAKGRNEGARVDRLETALAKQRDVTVRALIQTESLNISRENSYLKDEIRRLEEEAAELAKEAEALKAEADEIERAGEE